MSKRAAEKSEEELGALKQGERPLNGDAEDDEMGPFEDDQEDEFESEDEVMVAGEDGMPDDDEDGDGGVAVTNQGDKMEVDRETFIPGRTKLPPGEVLHPDLTTYDLLHTLQTTWPCLSFDILRDNLGTGAARKKYPATVYAVAGTQAAGGHEKENELLVMKLSKLSKMDKPDDEENEDEEDDEDEDEDLNLEPVLETKSIKLNTCTNRIRAYQRPLSADDDLTKPPPTLTASTLENGQIPIHDITPHLTALDTPGFLLNPSHSKPTYTVTAHGKTEGFAVAWSPNTHPSSAPLRLLTGDTSGRIFLTTRDAATGKWTTNPKPFTGHASSVEELHWSPTETHVFASASSDGTVRIWDARSKSHTPSLSLKVSDSDVNVLAWSHHKSTSHLLATGADDGVWSVWDLRNWKTSDGKTASTPAAHKQPPKPSDPPIATFNFHQEQITSLEWHPTDDAVMCVTAGDSTVTLWDLSVEHDDEESRYAADQQGVVPPQLLFVHFAEEVKECHWHPGQEGLVVCTGGSGVGVFKTISV